MLQASSLQHKHEEITPYQPVKATTRKVNLINILISQISLLNEVKLFIQSR